MPGGLAWSPLADVSETDDAYLIEADLPGVKQDQLEITVHRDTVTLRGTRQDEPEDARAYHRRERGRGSFGRTFGLPFPVDPDQVGAKLLDGVLILTLQRPEQDKPKRIRISAG